MTRKPRVRVAFLAGLIVAALGFTALYHYSAIKVFIIMARVHDDLTPQLEQQNIEWGAPVFIRIFKEEKQLELWLNNGVSYQLFSTYPICHFSGDLGPKQMEGDRQSPEGFYTVTPPLMNPRSNYHLAFNLGFPNPHDQLHGWSGSFLMVHGNCVSIGCYAITDPYIEDVYALMQAAFDRGASEIPVHIFPFRMTKDNMERHAHSVWIPFWKNLKTGYDLFESTQQIPVISIHDRNYSFAPVT